MSDLVDKVLPKKLAKRVKTPSKHAETVRALFLKFSNLFKAASRLPLKESFVLLCGLLPVLFVVVVAVLHTFSFIVDAIGSSLFEVLVPVLAVVFAVLVPILLNPVHSLLCLLGLFAMAALIYLSQGAEYLALVFLIVYVGALAILFLFVIMLLNVKDIMAAQRAAQRRGVLYFVSGAVGLLLALRMLGVISLGFESFFAFSNFAPAALEASSSIQDSLNTYLQTDILSLRTLYTDHAPLFMEITAILLLAMLGAIVLATGSVEAERSAAEISSTHTRTRETKGMNEPAFLFSLPVKNARNCSNFP